MVHWLWATALPYRPIPAPQPYQNEKPDAARIGLFCAPKCRYHQQTAFGAAAHCVGTALENQVTPPHHFWCAVPFLMVSPLVDFALLLAGGLAGFWLFFRSIRFFEKL